jgi:formylglycine-generating enzyme required for sulfatase activity
MSSEKKKPSSLPAGLRPEGDHFFCLRDESFMIWIPEGSFYMGQPEDELFAKPHEKPGRKVFLPEFFMDMHSVTNEQFRRFVEAGGYDRREFWEEEAWSFIRAKKIDAPQGWEHDDFNAPDQPAAGVSWYEAAAYARWAEKRLPTEAEWEKAARGADRRRFPWGNEFPTPDRVNFDQVIGHPTPKGAYPKGASPYGCMDMAGNVNNWCRDWYWDEFYVYCVEEGLDEAPLLDTALCEKLGVPRRMKVDRGGGYATAFQYLEILSCSDKVAWSPETRNLWNGFRCVIPIKKPSG